MLSSASGVIASLLSNSEVNDGTAVPAAYKNECQHTLPPKHDGVGQVLFVPRGYFIFPPLRLHPCVGVMSGGEERANAAVLAQMSTYHLILYELMRHIRHLSHHIRELLAFHFPPRSREPVWHVSYCPCVRTVHPAQLDERVKIGRDASKWGTNYGMD